MDQTQPTTAPVQQPVAPTPSPIPEKKSHIKTILFVLLGILFLSAMGFGGYYLGRTNINLPSPSVFPTQVSCTLEAKMCLDGSSVGRTGPNCEFICPESSGSSSASNFVAPADWKTYTNTKDGYTMKYPPIWFLYPNEPGKYLSNINTTELSNIDVKNTTSKSDVNAMIRMGIGVEKNSTTLDDYLERLKTNDTGEEISSDEVTVAGVKGTKKVVQGLGVNTHIYLQHNGNIYDIWVNGPNPSDDKEKMETFTQILSTFTFTK